MFADWEEHGMIENGLSAIVDESPKSDIGEVVAYVLSSPGKRVRPLILLFSAQAFGGDSRQALDAGLAIELVHAASLVHDDILDSGVERRGAPSAVERFGLEAALLTGDYLISKSIDLVSSYGQPVIRTFAGACMKMAEGEMMDLSRISSPKDYYHCVSRKTASLFAASARMGCLISGAATEDVSRFEQYGMHLGLAYQILDDMEEVLGVDQGKRSLKKSFTLPRVHSERLSQDQAMELCKDAVGSHFSAAQDSLQAAGGSEEMKMRLSSIAEQMTDRWVNECKLQSHLC